MVLEEKLKFYMSVMNFDHIKSFIEKGKWTTSLPVWTSID